MAKLRYISLFSGIEAWSCAVRDMPEYEPVAFCEIDPFASAVLKHHYPDVPNLGDITKVDWSKYNGLVDLVVGGSPCQGFSVAGLRKGLQDDRSCLALAYVQAIEQIQPRWWLWENVPGALTCNNGEDIKQFFAALNGLGYSISWCVLDSQYFSLAQRRRRIFACGYFGGWQYPAKVFFKPESLCRNPPARRQARKADPAGVEEGAGNRGVSGTLCASGAGLDRPSASGNQLDYLITHTHTAAGVPNRPGNGETGNSQQHPRHTNAQRPHAEPDGACYPLDIKSLHNDCGGRGLGIGADGDPAYALRTDHPCAVCSKKNTKRPCITGGGKTTFPTLTASQGQKLWLGNQEAQSGNYFILEYARQ